MYYKQLLEITNQWISDGAYEKALQELEWRSPNFDMARNIRTFGKFLAAWHSLRGGLINKKEMFTIWTKDIEPYAMSLEDEPVENLDVDKLIKVKDEKLRIGIVIEHIYGALSLISGIGDTNASKLLHLRLPHLFVMTDTAVRKLLKKKVVGEKFSPYSYAFNFLTFVKSDVNEAVNTLCKDKRLTREQGIEFLQNVHGRKRSLAKLMDECYHTFAHKIGEFPDEYSLNIIRQ